MKIQPSRNGWIVRVNTKSGFVYDRGRYVFSSISDLIEWLEDYLKRHGK